MFLVVKSLLLIIQDERWGQTVMEQKNLEIVSGVNKCIWRQLYKTAIYSLKDHTEQNNRNYSFYLVYYQLLFLSWAKFHFKKSHLFLLKLSATAKFATNVILHMFAYIFNVF